MDISENIVVYDIKVGRTYMNMNIKGQGHLLTLVQGHSDSTFSNFFFLGTKRPMTLKVDMQHRVLEYYQVYSHDYPGLTLTYFMARSNGHIWSLRLLYGKKVKNLNFQKLF